MHAHADKKQGSPGRSAASEVVQRQRNSEPVPGFTSNRPEAVAQRHVRELANASPRVVQLSAFRERVSQGAKANASAIVQARMDEPVAQRQVSARSDANHTGLPDRLKAGVESLSGYSMDDVRVHYNSSRPAQLQALAFAQGTDIHLGPGQERHLPHEAWHVVQQKQGRVRPTMQMKSGTAINDDAGLEREATVMGGRALQVDVTSPSAPERRPSMSSPGLTVLQPVWAEAVNWTTLNLAVAKAVVYGQDFVTNHLRTHQDAHADDMAVYAQRYAGRPGAQGGRNTMVWRADIDGDMGAMDYTNRNLIVGFAGTNRFSAYVSLPSKAFAWTPLNAANAINANNLRLDVRTSYDHIEVQGYVRAERDGTGALKTLEFKVTHLQSAW